MSVFGTYYLLLHTTYYILLVDIIQIYKLRAKLRAMLTEHLNKEILYLINHAPVI